MEFGERKRRRKSQSFKLVTDEDCDPSHAASSSCKDANGETKDAAVPDVWLGDEGLEIKRQITGMMRLLSDKTGRVYQRVGTEPGSSSSELQDRHLSWVHQPPVLSLVSEHHQSSNWSSTGDLEPLPSSISTPIPNGPGCGQYSTRSRALKILNNTKDLIEKNADALSPAVQETPCCMCNCKGTLQAILHELRTMRRLMQTQKASFGRQEKTASSCQPRLGLSSTSRHMPRKRRPIHKVAQLSVSSTRRAALSTAGASTLAVAPTESGKREECEKLDSSTPNVHPISCDVSAFPAQNNLVAQSTHKPLLNQLQEPQALEPHPHTHSDPFVIGWKVDSSETVVERRSLNKMVSVMDNPDHPLHHTQSEVRLAENYDVFISKTQLDSILVNYTRSGSLLFRKLVCAFFDDATLANSLPNGKRKRGLNDNRKGLDQNIVGAIKVFTEKYCTEHRIEKLPGPRDWVQILQDQIKLARRRLKRDAAEVEENSNGPSTSCDYNKAASVKQTVMNMTG